MATLGIVPARKGSTRVPGKNVRLLGGRPLVEWMLEAALGARTLDRLVVSSDDERVLEIARTHDPALPLRRPAELASDLAPAIGYVQHALEVLEGAGEGPFDTVVIAQPTSPFTLSADIDATVELLRTSGADSAVTMMLLDYFVHPAKLKILDGDRVLPYFEEEAGRMSFQELPPVYVRNGAVYASRRAVIDEGRVLGADCRAFVMPRERCVDINEALDFRFAEFLLRAENGPSETGGS